MKKLLTASGAIVMLAAPGLLMAQAGKCWEPAEKELKLSKYESWPGYAAGLPLIARRYCGLWGRGT